MGWIMAGQKHHHAGRACVRCRKELTDAASMEVGIGPICRKLDNAILAAQIPSDIAAARQALKGVPVEALDPQTVLTFAEVDVAVTSVEALTRADWRKEVKRLEWLLSFQASRDVALKPLTDTVRALGYVGLAALWEGKASTGVAKVRFADGRLYVAGPRNADFRYAIKQQIPGWKFHYAKGADERPEWSVPCAYHAEFRDLLYTYYPICEGRTEALEAAAHYIAVKPNPMTAPTTTVTAPAPITKSKVRIEAGTDWAKVYTPYNAGFIADLKTGIAYGERRWNPVERCWEVRNYALHTVEALVAKHYGESVKAAQVEEPVTVTLPAHSPSVMPF